MSCGPFLQSKYPAGAVFTKGIKLKMRQKSGKVQYDDPWGFHVMKQFSLAVKMKTNNFQSEFFLVNGNLYIFISNKTEFFS